MAATHLLSLAVLCLVLLLAASAIVPAATATTASGSYYGGGARMVVIARGAKTRVVISGAARGDRSNNRWPHHRGLVEDEVTPELGGGMLGATNSGIGYDALDKNRPECQGDNQCAAKSGGSYTRPCTYKDHCPH